MFAERGADGVKRELQKLAKRYPDAAAGALYSLGVDVVRDAVLRTPVEYGVLRGSAYVAPPTRPPDIRVEVGYGAEYAPYVHENLTARHPRGGEAKFLERAIHARAARAAQLLVKRTRQLVRSGRGYGGVASEFPRRPNVRTRPGGGRFSGRRRVR